MRTICKQYKNNIRTVVSGAYWVGFGWGMREVGSEVQGLKNLYMIHNKIYFFELIGL